MGVRCPDLTGGIWTLGSSIGKANALFLPERRSPTMHQLKKQKKGEKIRKKTQECLNNNRIRFPTYENESNAKRTRILRTMLWSIRNYWPRRLGLIIGFTLREIGIYWLD